MDKGWEPWGVTDDWPLPCSPFSSGGHGVHTVWEHWCESRCSDEGGQSDWDQGSSNSQGPESSYTFSGQCPHQSWHRAGTGATPDIEAAM